jgi:LacI family transcriptional regulator
MNATKPVRMQDIADEAGVSRAAVSMALRNHPSLPQTTCKRIQQLAEKLGYRPNPLVSALMTYLRTVKTVKHPSLTLAFVSKFSQKGPWKSFLSPDLITNAAASAEQLGYRLEEFWMGDLGMSNERFWKVLYHRGVRGMILAPLPAAHAHLSFDWSRFCTVAIGNTLVQPRLHRVSTNRHRAMELAVRRLRHLGYRKMGLAINADQDGRVDHQWAAAFEWEQQQVRAAEHTKSFLASEEKWTERHFAQWYQKNRPEVILSDDARIIAWLKNLGQAVPKDIGFVHLWNPDKSGKYAGLYHDPPAIGATAVNFLVGLIQRNESGIPETPQTLLLEASWVDGDSLARRWQPTTPN